MAALAVIAVAAATVSVAAPVAAMAPAKKMQKSLQSSNGLPRAGRPAGSNARGPPHFLSAALWCGLLDME